MYPNHKGKIVLFATLATVSLGPRPAAADVDSDPQVWTALLGTATLGDGYTPRLWLDTHLRRSDGNTVHIFRPGLGTAVFPWLSVWAGYGWVPVIDDVTSETVNEHRAWEQVILKHTFGSLSVQSRTRFEQRFSENGDDMGLRIRQFVRLAWQPKADSPFGAVMWDELFVGLNETDWGAPKGMDQNRLFTGVYAKLVPHLRLEMGYLFVFINRGDNDTAAHVLATNLFFTLKR